MAEDRTEARAKPESDRSQELKKLIEENNDHKEWVEYTGNNADYVKVENEILEAELKGRTEAFVEVEKLCKGCPLLQKIKELKE